jgi:hypothetical protein
MYVAGLDTYASTSFAIAPVWALTGTNTQARLSRERLLEDPDPRVVKAARLWSPTRWLARPTRRRRRAAAEAEVRSDPVLWRRYERLCQELSAWNALESSVALAFAASVTVLIGSLLHWWERLCASDLGEYRAIPMTHIESLSWTKGTRNLSRRGSSIRSATSAAPVGVA